MIAYAIRRVLLIIPTLFAIMVVNFVIVQAAPGGPVEQRLALLEQSVANMQHFITAAQRPDLSRGALAGEPGAGAAASSGRGGRASS